MATGNSTGAAAAEPGDSAEPMSRLRDQLFKAMSIIACCRLACASLLSDGDDPEIMADALQAAHDLIAATAAELPPTGDVPGEATAPESRSADCAGSASEEAGP